MGAVLWRLLGIRWRIREIGNKCNEIGILLPDTLYIYIVFRRQQICLYSVLLYAFCQPSICVDIVNIDWCCA